MITTDKVTEIFCILDEFCKNLDTELTKNLHIVPIDRGYKRMRNCKGQMSKSEIMTILLRYHFGSFHNFKHYRREAQLLLMRRDNAYTSSL